MQSVRNVCNTFILYCTLHVAITIMYCSYIYNEVLSCIFKINTRKMETIHVIMEKCQMSSLSLSKKILSNLLMVWKWNHLFHEKLFQKEKIIVGFLPGEFQVICGSMVGRNRRLLASTETPESGGFFFLTLTFREKGCHLVKKLIQFHVCFNYIYI